MANEFIIRKGYKSLSDSEVTGSLLITGNVGIGVTTTTQKLHVDGNIRVGDANDVIYSNRFTTLSNTNLQITANTGYDTLFFNGGSERMRITTGGSVGIGTASPQEKLEINGNILVNKGTTNRTAYLSDDGLYISRTTVADSYPLKIVANSSNSNNLDINARSRISLILNSTTRLVANDQGNVGIGTTSPLHPLHVNGVISGSDTYINGWNSVSASLSTLTTDLDTLEGKTLVSESAQIDHDQTTNFVANEHIDHSTITIGSGKGLSGGGTIDTSRSLTLNTGSAHFTDGVVGSLPANTVSSSAQIASDISGSITSFSGSIAGRVSTNESSISSLNGATGSYLLNTTDTLTGNLTVTGTLTAQEFHTEFVSASILFDSGSTKFGDSSDDVHNFTGSVNVKSLSTGAKLTIEDDTAKTELQHNLHAFRIKVDPDNADTNSNFRIEIDGSEKLRIQNNGRVGIGESSPLHPLHVVGIVSASAFHGDGSNLTGLVSSSHAEYADNSTSASHAEFSDNSNLLDSLDSSQFLRSDTADTATGVMTFENTVILDSNSADSPYLRFTDSSDIRFNLYNDGSNTFTITREGNNGADLRLRADSTNYTGSYIEVGNGNTFGKDINVTGDVTASAFTGDGSSLTGLVSSSHAEYADNSTSASHAEYADNATSSSHSEVADNVPYSGLTGTTPTWNQDTTGTAATASYVAAANIDGTVASATNADTVDSKHATDFTLDYVTDNGATTTNNLTIGNLTTTGSITITDIGATRGIKRNNDAYDLRLMGGTSLDDGAYISLGGELRGGSGNAVAGAVEITQGGTNYAARTSISSSISFKAKSNAGTSTDLFIEGSSGNIGVGLTSPLYDLDVNGNIGVRGGQFHTNGSTDSYKFLSSTAAKAIRARSLQVSTSYSGTIPDDGILFSTDTNLYRSAANTLRTNDSLIIDNNLGIGITAPASKLHVSSSTFNDHITLGRDSDELGITVSGGQVLIEGGLSPFTNDSQDLGRSDKHWQDLYITDNIYVSQSATLALTGSLSATGNITANAFYGDGSNLTGISTDNFYLTALSFNTGNGVLTATVNGASNPTVDLDGRYPTFQTHRLQLSNGEISNFNGSMQMIIDANDGDSDITNYGDYAGSYPFGIYFTGDNDAATTTLGSGLVKVWHTGHFKKGHIDYLHAISSSLVTSTEFGYLDGVTSNIQTQLNAKLESESDTLDTVVERGAVTDNNITVNSLLTNTDSTYTIGTNSTRFSNGYFDNLHVKDKIQNNTAAYINYISNQGHRFYVDANGDDTAHQFQILANTSTYDANNVIFTMEQTGDADFTGGISMVDSKGIDWSGNNILSHNGTQTYLGDNSSASTLTLTGTNASFEGTVTAATSFISDAISTSNNDPGDGNAQFSGYGVIGHRGALYLTNAETDSAATVQIGVGGVHNAAPKLVVGTTNSTFYTNVVPQADSTYSLGTTSLRWANIWVDSINGSAPINGSGTATYIPKFSDSDTLTSSGMLQAASGNFSIGVTTPNAKFSIAGDLSIGTAATDVLRLHNESGVATIDGYSTRNIALGSATNGEVMRIDNANGRVGIGTDSPAVTFHANGFARFNGGIQLDGNTRTIYAIDNTDLLLGTNNAEKMRIDSTGGVGIGETSIDARLHITALASSGISNIKVESPGASKWAFGIPASQTYLAFDETNDDLSTPTMVLTKTTKRVGIGTTGPSYTLDVTGTGRFTSNLLVEGTLTETSAKRFKENIEPLESQLENIEKLNPVSFEWKKDGKSDIGLIAEEVKEIIPTLVSEEDGEVKGIQYTKLTAILIKAVQEQQKQINELKEEIFILKKK